MAVNRFDDIEAHLNPIVKSAFEDQDAWRVRKRFTLSLL